MRVRLLTGRITGEGEVSAPGDELDLPDEEARRLLEAGDAEPVARKRVDQRETR